MTKRKVWALVVAGLLSFPTTGLAEKTPPSRPEAGRLQEIAVTHNYTLGRPFHIRVTPDGKTVLFLRSGANDAKSDLYAYDVGTKETKLLLSAERLLGGKAEELSVAEKAMRERKRIKTSGFTEYRLSADGTRIVLKLSGKVWLHDRTSGLSARIETPEGVLIDPRLSPDNKRLAFVLDDNLFVMKLGDIPKRAPKRGPRLVTGRVRAITKGGTPQKPFGQAEFVAQEEMSRYHGYWWSPDSKKLIYQSTDLSELEEFTIADASRPEKSANVFPYPRPGKANAKVRLFVSNVRGGGKREIRWDRKKYPYLTRVKWSKNAPPSIIVQARDQKSQSFRRVELSSGRTFEMFHEADDAWLNITDSAPRWMADGKSYLWLTEESGRWQLERHWPKLGGTKSGLKKRQVVVDGEQSLLAITHVDEKRGFVWFTATPKAVDVELFRAPLTYGEAPVRVSPAGGDASATFAADGSVYVLTRSTLTELPVSTVYGVDEGGPNGTLEIVAKAPKRLPKVELIPPADAGGFNAAVIRPQDFDPKKKYPVVVYVYGGPGFTVVKSTAANYFVQQWMADHGFIVVSVDNRGTPRRGRTFERAIREKFGDVPLEDQVKGLTALAKKLPELDMNRVGVYGWSFGGYMSALAVMRRPDIFKVAVSGAPVVDWEYYDTHYTERFLGLPDDLPKAYESSSLLTYAKDLKRPLMLVHGIADDNVYFAHTLQLTDALFAAGKKFELLPLVGLTHQVSDPKVRETLYQRMVQFLGEVLW